jgi:hypothetical protein
VNRLALALRGAGRITGVDFLPRSMTARARRASRHPQRAVRLRRPARLAGADVLLSFDAFEHIDEPRAFLRCQLLAHRPSRPNRRVSGAG